MGIQESHEGMNHPTEQHPPNARIDQTIQPTIFHAVDPDWRTKSNAMRNNPTAYQQKTKPACVTDSTFDDADVYKSKTRCAQMPATKQTTPISQMRTSRRRFSLGIG
jgi:hypothetical protein